MGALKKSQKLHLDYDPQARKNLMEILEEESRNLYPHEVSWILSLSLSEVYEVVPRAKSLNSAVRFDPRTIKLLRGEALQLSAHGSLKTEKTKNNKSLPNRKKKGKVELCL